MVLTQEFIGFASTTSNELDLGKVKNAYNSTVKENENAKLCFKEIKPKKYLRIWNHSKNQRKELLGEYVKYITNIPDIVLRL